MHYFRDTSVAKLVGENKADFNSLQNQADRPPPVASGDYWGSGKRNPMCRIRSWSGPSSQAKKEDIKTPPTNLA